ncbi:hypothetical protein LS71_002750 [Helicobacter jaachi]|uniref:Uncharacterized protein n=1 Tax=Helicobacter jaachi TaxID=1677920 RepID=A0A4U8TG45_9HELI|nr:hypothetical protein [Helicobacter jaachi]TLD97677.1 hypothetical protein LS71_002750 [Helicobacter jaachi]
MKSWLMYAFFALALYFFYNMFERTNHKIEKTQDELRQIMANTSVIIEKVNADSKEASMLYKMQKNNDVWQGTACAYCHNSIETALPIYKRSVSEAILIVRLGTPHTQNKGMPLFSPRATRDKNSITDSELKVRLDSLYTKELLDSAKELPPDVIYKVNNSP